jgi:aspartate/methionine/tyrosine aminotransferase
MAALAAIPGASVPEPQGAFYAFPRIAGLDDSTQFTADLVRQSGVAFAPGVAFGADGEGYVRLCFAATEQMLAEALTRFREFMVDRIER